MSRILNTNQLLLVLSGMLMTVVAILAFAVFESIKPVTPPLSYDQATYPPERADLCPGESLVYTNTLTVNRADTIFFGQTWFAGHGTSARPALPGILGEVKFQIFSYATKIGPVRRSNIVPVLIPGDYEMHFSAWGSASASVSHSVPFSIRQGCIGSLERTWH